MSNNKRLFIAILPTPETQSKLIQYQKTHLSNLSFHITSQEDLHLTMIFLGDNKDENIQYISKAMDTACKKIKPFTLKLETVEYGPTPTHQRLVWIKGEANKELQKLKNELQEELYSYPDINFKGEHKGFTPHITLAKIKSKDVELPSAEKIETKLPLNISANSIILFEPTPTKYKHEYTTLYQSYFKKD